MGHPAIIRYYDKHIGEHYYRRADDKIECALKEEFITVASSKFLEYIVQACTRVQARITDTIAASRFSSSKGDRQQ